MNNMFNTPFEIHRRYDLKGQALSETESLDSDLSSRKLHN